MQAGAARPGPASKIMRAAVALALWLALAGCAGNPPLHSVTGPPMPAPAGWIKHCASAPAPVECWGRE